MRIWVCLVKPGRKNQGMGPHKLPDALTRAPTASLMQSLIISMPHSPLQLLVWMRRRLDGSLSMETCSASPPMSICFVPSLALALRWARRAGCISKVLKTQKGGSTSQSDLCLHRHGHSGGHAVALLIIPFLCLVTMSEPI